MLAALKQVFLNSKGSNSEGSVCRRIQRLSLVSLLTLILAVLTCDVYAQSGSDDEDDSLEFLDGGDESSETESEEDLEEFAEDDRDEEVTGASSSADAAAEESAALDAPEPRAAQATTPSLASSERTPEQEEARFREQQTLLDAQKLQAASSRTVRRFHEVLEELLSEFGFDVRQGQLKSLKNLAIRRVQVNSALPRSYEPYLETLVSERLRDNARIKLIDCIACKTKTSILNDGKLIITSPATNLGQLRGAALQLGIESFMDVILVYHTTHMVLAFKVFDVQTKETLWARSYNSETIRSRFQKLAIDYKQIETARESDEYQPEYRLMFGLGGAALPNVAGTDDDSRFLQLQFRATEKFDNRRSEFGLEMSFLFSLASVINDFPTDQELEAAETPDEAEATEGDEAIRLVPFENALLFHAMYVRNFLRLVESYDAIRHGVNVGLGGLIASGYLAPSVRLGWDVYFGRRFVASLAASYLLPSSVLVNSQTIKTAGGAGGGITVSLNF